MQSKVIRPTIRILCFVLCLAGIAQIHAQDTNASLTGTVTDPNGAAIPGVSLTLTNERTLFKIKFVAQHGWFTKI